MSSAYGDREAAAAEPTAAGGTLSDTAFRRAEKRYQLHYEQQLRNRKGRLRGGKLVLQPTDLSDVVDIRNITSSDHVAMCTLQQSAPSTACICHPGPPCAGPSSSCSITRSSSITALVFKRHPGLVVFPAAVPAHLQLQLMQAALQEWPDPPARTNHTRVYGMTLCQLFHAAQQDWSLLELRQQQQQEQQQQEAGVSSTTHQQQQQPPQQCHTCQQDMVCQEQQQQQQQQHCHLQRPVDPEAGSTPATTANNINSHSNSPWSPIGTGPKASVLLRKLRWVCLGAPYNWTDRVYEPHLPHRPLPPLLVRLAQQYAELAQRAQAHAAAVAEAAAAFAAALAAADHTAATAAGTSLQSGANGSCSCAGQLEAAVSGKNTVAQSIDSTLGSKPGSAQQQNGSVCSSTYVPNAALVNYYHSGGTLNGHKDDVERDLSQPIVTLSLGCDAVFLVGGLTRDVEPTALLLQSGDIVVMGHEARACYHGVPRVLTDNPLPDDLLQAAEQAGQLYQPYLQHMQGCRVNISIRST